MHACGQNWIHWLLQGGHVHLQAKKRACELALQRDGACELVASSHWLVLLPPKRPCRVLTDLRGNRLLDLGNTQGGQPPAVYSRCSSLRRIVCTEWSARRGHMPQGAAQADKQDPLYRPRAGLHC